MGTRRDPLRAAQALRATIRATRQETEEARRLAPQVVEGLIAAGLCRLAVPVSLGGHEAEPVVTSMYEAAGTSALYIDCPIERAHRDIYAVMQHVQLTPIWLEDAGRVRLGLPPQHPFFGV